MIGVEPNGIGFGNVSIRAERANQFYITGSGTGGLERLSPEHYSLVVDYDFARNWLRCNGRVVASSESLTHAAIYEADRDIAAVFHVHSAVLWKRWRGVLPTTNADVEYGTPAMAAEVRRLFAESDVRQKQIFVMAGHEN